MAYQNAVAYAKERLQSRSLSGKKAPEREADPILVHPDVRKMLLSARSYAEGGRALCSWVALMLDQMHHHPDESVRKKNQSLVELLTPVVKAFLTDNAWEATSSCMQVYGGHGFIREWGMEQYVRDARINMIYEGTNTIQSLDLLGRKVLSDGGARMKLLGGVIEQFVQESQGVEPLAPFLSALVDLGQKVQKLSMELGMKAMQNPDEVGAAAVDYLRVVGHLVFAYLFARMAKISLERLAQQPDDSFYQAKLHTCRFYFERQLPETASAIRRARSGSDNLMKMPEDWF